ncbi:hypothetical protein ABBQ32_007608 [Trebouxia sp. C0010 RCD-2024]
MPRWLSPSKQKVLKALLKGSVFLPYHAASETLSSLSQNSKFRFGAAYSSKPLLSTAVVDCVNAIKTQLGPGRHPHFCQLLVTAEAHGTHIEYAPLECLSSKEAAAPVVIGGAVQGLLANESSNVAGVSLFAAHMPGVEFMPFHVKSTSLPELTAAQWDSLLQSSMSSQDNHCNVAAVLLSEPHFTQVDELISRIQGVLPSTPLVGGVTQPNAWGVNPWGGQRSLRGAVFLNQRTYDEGAVGCFMQGRLKMDAMCDQGCRPVGEAATVTSSHRGTIMQLDHQTALLVVRQMFQSLSDKDRELQIQIGLNTAGNGNSFVTRSISSFNPHDQTVQVAVSDVPEGSVVQLHVRDPQWAQNNILKQLRGYVARLPEGIKSNPQQLGSLSYSCGTLAHEEERMLHEAVPKSPFQGAQFQGEFGPASGGLQTKSFLHSYSSTFGLIRPV